MTDEKFHALISAFQERTKHEKTLFLARFDFELTIAAREKYVPQDTGVANPEKLRVLNEIQHRITGRLLDILRDRERQGAEEHVLGFAFEAARRAGCVNYVEYACQKAMKT